MPHRRRAVTVVAWLIAIAAPLGVETLVLALGLKGWMFIAAYVAAIAALVAVVLSLAPPRRALLLGIFLTNAVLTPFVSFLLLLALMRGHN